MKLARKLVPAVFLMFNAITIASASTQKIDHSENYASELFRLQIVCMSSSQLLKMPNIASDPARTADVHTLLEKMRCSEIQSPLSREIALQRLGEGVRNGDLRSIGLVLSHDLTNYFGPSSSEFIYQRNILNEMNSVAERKVQLLEDAAQCGDRKAMRDLFTAYSGGNVLLSDARKAALYGTAVVRSAQIDGRSSGAVQENLAYWESKLSSTEVEATRKLAWDIAARNSPSK